MPGYSGTPLVKKLGYKPNHVVFLDGAPDDYLTKLGERPEGVVFLERPSQPADLVHLFTGDREELRRKLAGHRRRIVPSGMIWVSWPKRASKVPTDVTEDVIRELALPMGLVDVKVCAVDEVWAGLKLVIRKELRGA